MLEREQASLEARKSHLTNIIGERRGLVDRIGKGNIQVGSSLENTLRIGRIRKRVREHTVALEERLANIESELDVFGSIEDARDYLSKVERMKGQLAELSDLVAGGDVKQGELSIHQKEYELLRTLPSQNPTLKRAIQRIARSGVETAKPQMAVPETKEKSPKRERTRGSKDKRPITFELPSRRKLRGKEGSLVKILSQAQRRISANQLVKEVYPGLNRKKANSRLINTAHHVRDFLREEGLDILVVRNFKRGLTYYSLRRFEKTIQESVVKPKPPVEEMPREEVFEIQGLSKTNIAVIAATLSTYKDSLSPFLQAVGISYIDERTMQNLQDMGKDEEALKHLAKLNSPDVQQERTEFLNNLRLRSFDKARSIIESADFEQILEKVHKENPDIWAMLFNLYEINDVIERLRQKEITSFIKELIELPKGKVIMVGKDGTIILPPKEDPTKEVGEPLPAIGLSNKSQDLVVIEPKVEDLRVVEAEQSEQKPVSEVVRGVVSTAASKVSEIVRLTKKTEIKYGVEREDPHIRARLHKFFEELESKSDFKQSANPAAVNRVFPRLKQKSVEVYIHDKLISVTRRGDYYWFDHVDIATALYLYDFGRNMNSRHKRQVQEVAREVFKIREERRKRLSNGNGK